MNKVTVMKRVVSQ